MPECAAKGFADFELGRDSGRGKVLFTAIEYWCMVRQMGYENVRNSR